LGDDRVEVNGIEIFTVNAAGLIVSVRSFFEQPEDFALDNYFTTDRTEH
jgi:hypothetical protein